MSNLLQYEESPYLYGHKDDPFEWYPWCDEAFNRAKEESKPLFISIGYSTCHWCHVMQREVFKNVEAAAFLNKHFICIKVDKEERPDIDQYYQNVYQTLNKKAGGWPTSIFCTPQNSPFFAATYIPLEPKYNIVGFRDLTQHIQTKIATKDEILLKNAAEIQAILLENRNVESSQILDSTIQEHFIAQCKNNFEPTYGGFTLSTKFPQVSTLNTMMSVFELDKDGELESMLRHTLDNMIAGGFYDLVDGGFCRYSTDAEWLVPHFEKMTYDNGLLCKLYLRAFTLFNVQRYLEIAQEIGSYMYAFMMQEYFLYSASDADTKGVEGEYYIYSRFEVLSAIKASGYDEMQAKRMTMRLLVSNTGNFEGKNIIHFANIQKEEWFESIKPELQKLRELRSYPFIDKRIQTSWSAMMIEAFFSLSVYDEKYKHIAQKSLSKLLDKMYINGKLMHSSLIEKEAKIEAYLEDYAYLSKTLINAYEISSLELYLDLAKNIVESAMNTHYKSGMWKFSVGEFETFAEIEDGSYPSCIAIMIESLLTLGTLVDDGYRGIAVESLRNYNAKVMNKPILYASMVEQTIRFFNEDRVLKLPYNSSLTEVLGQYNYPFFHLKYHKESYYELCSNSSCFAKSEVLPAADFIS